MKKRGMALILAAALMLGFTGCTTEEVTVPVVSVGMLTGAGTAAEKYAGEVVSERVTEVQRDTALDIGELCVQEGDRVKAGDVLFSYDTDLLELDLERAKLELEQMRAAVSTFTTQIQELQTASHVTFGNADHQTQICLCQLFFRLIITKFHPLC